MATDYETLFPNNTWVGVRTNGSAFGFDDDADNHFAIYDHRQGSRVFYERSSILDQD